MTAANAVVAAAVNIAMTAIMSATKWYATRLWWKASAAAPDGAAAENMKNRADYVRPVLPQVKFM